MNQADKCVYSKFDNHGNGVIICLYVDDMLIFGTSIVHIQETKDFLSKSFQMKDMGEADVILGIKIKRDGGRIKLGQSHYIDKVLNRFKLQDLTPISSPMEQGMKFTKHTGKPISQLEYAKIIGSLMYAMTCTRPDIAFAVGKLSRFTSNPGPQHWLAIRRVLRYLKGTINYGITYSGEPPILEGYSDASWITNEEDNSSTSGWVFVYGGGAISWASKKQMVIADSTMSAEFIALASAANEAEWLRNLMFEIPLLPKPISPVAIHSDCTTALGRAYSQVYNGKSRHIALRHSLVQDLIIHGVITLDYVNTKFNLADFFTKAMSKVSIEQASIEIGLCQ